MRQNVVSDCRDTFVQGAGPFGFAVVLGTQLLGAFKLISAISILTLWMGIIGLVILRYRKRIPELRVTASFDPVESMQLWLAASIAGVTLFLALTTGSSHSDPNAYHLPRVFHWIQNGSVDPYPTHIDRQIWIGPAAEYFMLHARLLLQTDHVFNLVAWFAFVLLAPVVSLIGRELGAGAAGQVFAVVYVLTLPMAIVQSSGAHVDVFAAFWFALTVAQLLRLQRRAETATRLSDFFFLGCAAGMALLAKATNVLFLAPFVLWTAFVVARNSKGRRRQLCGGVLVAFVSLIATNGKLFFDNYKIWHNAMGPHEDYGVVNAIITPQSITSNLVRNLSLHLNSRDATWNKAVEYDIERIHLRLGLDDSDPRTTLGDYRFGVSEKLEDEGASGNPWHFLLIVIAAVIALARPRSPPLHYLIALIVCAVLFAALLKWQPWASRFHLQLFVAAAGVVGAALDTLRLSWMPRLVAFGLVVLSLPAVLLHHSRPLLGPTPVTHIPFDRQLIEEETEFREYKYAAAILAHLQCHKVGLIEDPGAAEYPFWRYTFEASSQPVEIRNFAVMNETRKTSTEVHQRFKPCAVVSISHAQRVTIAPSSAEYSREWQGNFITVFVPRIHRGLLWQSFRSGGRRRVDERRVQVENHCQSAASVACSERAGERCEDVNSDPLIADKHSDAR